MLKKKRVTKKLFDQVIKEGATLSGSFFVFKYIYKYNSPTYAFVTPKKLKINAVKRNRLRRRGYSIIREIPLNKGLGIFFYKKESLGVDLGMLKKDIIDILKKSKIL